MDVLYQGPAEMHTLTSNGETKTVFTIRGEGLIAGVGVKGRGRLCGERVILTQMNVIVCTAKTAHGS